MNVFDASALLAFLQGEDGATRVEEALGAGGCCGTANWSEVAQKVLSHGGNWDLARTLLISFGLSTEAVTADDAVSAARRWRHGEELSLADRLCLRSANASMPTFGRPTGSGARLAESARSADPRRHGAQVVTFDRAMTALAAECVDVITV